MNQSALLYACILSVSISACGLAISSTPTASQIPTPAVAATSATRPSQPTATTRPTASRIAETPTQTPTATRQTTATLPAKTAEAIATVQAFGDLCGGGVASRWSLSPYGGWVAAECDQNLVVTSLENTSSWRIEFTDVYASENGYREGTLYPRHWTQDGRYLFVSTHLQIDGALYYLSGMGLLRLDLMTGHVSEYLAPQESAFDFYAFSFSPNDKYLWYIFQPERPLVLRIQDLGSGIIRAYRLPDDIWGAGSLAWSNSSKTVVFSAGIGEDNFEIGTLELESGDLSFVPIPDKRILFPLDWIDDNTVALREFGDTENWFFQVDKKTLVQGD